MSSVSFEKARSIHRLARYFRDKAGETEWAEFVDMMTQAADELDALARSVERRCAAARPAGERRALAMRTRRAPRRAAEIGPAAGTARGER
jgi:hypothetical protein